MTPQPLWHSACPWSTAPAASLWCSALAIPTACLVECPGEVSLSSCWRAVRSGNSLWCHCAAGGRWSFPRKTHCWWLPRCRRPSHTTAWRIEWLLASGHWPTQQPPWPGNPHWQNLCHWHPPHRQAGEVHRHAYPPQKWVRFLGLLWAPAAPPTTPGPLHWCHPRTPSAPYRIQASPGSNSGWLECDSTTTPLGRPSSWNCLPRGWGRAWHPPPRPADLEAQNLWLHCPDSSFQALHCAILLAHWYSSDRASSWTTPSLRSQDGDLGNGAAPTTGPPAVHLSSPSPAWTMASWPCSAPCRLGQGWSQHLWLEATMSPGSALSIPPSQPQVQGLPRTQTTLPTPELNCRSRPTSLHVTPHHCNPTCWTGRLA